MDQQAQHPQTGQTRTFQCPGCGADLNYDAAKGVLACGHCGHAQPIDTPVRWEAEEHTDFDTLQTQRRWEGRRQIACESCGGSWVVEAAQAADACPFCGRAHVAAQDADMLAPDAVIPFAIDNQEAINRFKAWLAKRRMSPRALRAEAVAGHWRGVYYPYWTYDASTSTQYGANAGHYYYVTETRTRTVNGKRETYTEQVRHTRWEYVTGTVSRSFNDILIRAVKLTEKAAAPEDFDLQALKPYLPEFLSGFLARRYEVSLQEGYDQASELMDAQIRQDIIRDVAADEVRIDSMQVRGLGRSFKHILLPLWGNRYTYRGKGYDVWVNGQTGKVSGKAPISPWKVALCVLVGIPAVIALGYAFMWLMEWVQRL